MGLVDRWNRRPSFKETKPIQRKALYNQTERTSLSSQSNSLKYEFPEIWPQIQDAICPILRPKMGLGRTFFHLARLEAKIPVDGGWQGPTLSGKFFTGHFDKEVIASMPASNHVLRYVPIWKCANNQIKEYLGSVFNTSNAAKPPGSTVACVVTVVRDPIEHFLSGYNEIEYRWSRMRATPEWEREVRNLSHWTELPGTTTRFASFLTDILDPLQANKFLYFEYAHVFAMSRVLAMTPRITAYLPSLANLTHQRPQFLQQNCPGFPTSLVQVPPPKIPWGPIRWHGRSGPNKESGLIPFAPSMWSTMPVGKTCHRNPPSGTGHHFVEMLVNDTYRFSQQFASLRETPRHD